MKKPFYALDKNTVSLWQSSKYEIADKVSWTYAILNGWVILKAKILYKKLNGTYWK